MPFRYIGAELLINASAQHIGHNNHLILRIKAFKSGSDHRFKVRVIYIGADIDDVFSGGQKTQGVCKAVSHQMVGCNDISSHGNLLIDPGLNG